VAATNADAKSVRFMNVLLGRLLITVMRGGALTGVKRAYAQAVVPKHHQTLIHF
jgi:hypothetical protein